jgi:hypothetical protein
MSRRLLVLAFPALLAATPFAHANQIPGTPGAPPAQTPALADPSTTPPGATSAQTVPAPATGPAMLAPGAASGGISGRFITIAVGAAVGAMMPQLVVVDGLVLMSAVMGGMIGDMAYNSAHGMMQK